MQLSKMALTAGILASAAAVIGLGISLYDRIPGPAHDTGGLSLEVRDPETTLHREESGAGAAYSVLLSGEIVILNNNSRSMLLTGICVQKYFDAILHDQKTLFKTVVALHWSIEMVQLSTIPSRSLLTISSCSDLANIYRFTIN